MQNRTEKGTFWYYESDNNNNIFIFFQGFNQPLAERNYLLTEMRKFLSTSISFDYLHFDYFGCGDSLSLSQDTQLYILLKEIQNIFETINIEMYDKVYFISYGFGGFISGKLKNIISNPSFSIKINYPSSISFELIKKIESQNNPIIDLYQLIPGEDYKSLSDINQTDYYSLYDLGSDFNNLHGTLLSQQFLLECLKQDFVTDGDIHVFTEDHFKRNFSRKHDNFHVIKNTNSFYYSLKTKNLIIKKVDTILKEELNFERTNI